MASEKYQEYLCSREWGLKREAVIERSNGVCERCKRNPGAAVHHKTYARIYKEPLTDLIYLCDECHDFVHGREHVDPMNEEEKVYTRKFVLGLVSAHAREIERLREYHREQMDYIHSAMRAPVMYFDMEKMSKTAKAQYAHFHKSKRRLERC